MLREITVSILKSLINKFYHFIMVLNLINYINLIYIYLPKCHYRIIPPRHFNLSLVPAIPSSLVFLSISVETQVNVSHSFAFINFNFIVGHRVMF